MAREIQIGIVVAILATYFVDVAVLGPEGSRVYLIIGELGLIGAAIYMSRWLKDIPPAPGEFAVAAFVAAMVLVVPFAGSDMDLQQRLIFTVLGYTGAMCTWVVARLGWTREYKHHPLLERILIFTVGALATAIGFSFIATLVIAAVAVFSPGETKGLGEGLLLTYRGYFVAAFLVGPVVAVFFPITRWTLGALLVAMIAMVLIYTPAGPAVRAFAPETAGISDLAAGLAIAFFAGPIGLASAWNFDWELPHRAT
jgi:hypothetical protein